MASKPHYRVSHDGSAPQMVHDGLQNLVSGLGTKADKRSANRFGYATNNFDFVQLEAAYQTNWIARDIVQVPVNDGLREWREWQSDRQQDIVAEEKRLRLQYNYKLARYWARLYGGSVILVLTDQPLDQPLDINRIGKGSVKRLVVLERWEVKPQVINFHDPLADDYLLPEWYTVRGGTAQMIHSSHLVRIDGEEMPRRLRELNEGWGDSTLRKVLEDLQDVAATKGGIASMIQEANVDTVSREGLSDELASDQEEAILKRFALAGQMKSLVNMMLLDGSETLERKSLAFSGLGEILDRFMTWISGAADIPTTRLFGRAPAGENSTGEGDLNNYYDAVASAQEAQYRPDLERLDEFLLRSALGEVPKDATWNWRPLYQESGTELAQQRLADAQTDDIRLQQGVVKPSHVALKLQSNGEYALEEQEITRMQREEGEGLFDDEGEDGDPSTA